MNELSKTAIAMISLVSENQKTLESFLVTGVIMIRTTGDPRWRFLSHFLRYELRYLVYSNLVLHKRTSSVIRPQSTSKKYQVIIHYTFFLRKGTER